MPLLLPDGVRRLRHLASRGAHARHTPPHHSAAIASALIPFDDALLYYYQPCRTLRRPSLAPTEHASYTQGSAQQLRTSLDVTARIAHTDDIRHGA